MMPTHQVHLNPALDDGTVMMLPSAVIIGTRPRTELQLAGHHARWLVQQGLIDILSWLGEKPIPKHPTTGQDILAVLKSAAEGN